jgi:hypothetical protein
MKKLSLYVFLGLLWCNVGFAEKIILDCKGTYNYFGGEKSINNSNRKIEVDTEKRNYRDLYSTIYINLIITNDNFFSYSLDGSNSFGYWVQIGTWNRSNGDLAFDTTKTNKETYKKIRTELDKVDNGKNNFKIDETGHEIYSVSNLENNRNEIKKYNIIKSYAEETKGINPDYSRSEYNCKKITNLQLPKCEGSDTSQWINCKGTHRYNNGDKYVGEFKDGLKHGQGTYLRVNGDKYVGEWRYEKPNGQGIYTYTDGAKYVGGWKDGKRHGQGTYTFASGTVKKGIWKNNKLVEPN